jgi:hypothetical protein
MFDLMTLAEQIHRSALRQPPATIAASLQETIGQRLVAFAVGVRNPKLVGRWARGEHMPRQAHERALRDLFHPRLRGAPDRPKHLPLA